jgi:large subunit ribosomal protein L24
MKSSIPKLKIKKGATVEVIAGSDKGKKGTVTEVNALKMKVIVQGIRIQTHYDKKDGLLKKEGFIDYSNLRLVDAPAAPKKASSKAKPKSGAAKKASS